MEISNRESIDFRLFFFLKEYTSEPCQGAIIVSSRNVKSTGKAKCYSMREHACRCVSMRDQVGSLLIFGFFIYMKHR
jgi:hypothetical protein